MTPMIQHVHLPNGHHLTIKPVFGGLYFKADELNNHQSAFPAGWTIAIHSEEETTDVDTRNDNDDANDHNHRQHASSKHVHRYSIPTLRGDTMFISSISYPSNSDFKPSTSPSRQIAMILWCTLYWYFHQPAPPLYLASEESELTPDAGKPRGDWRIKIKKEGVLRGRHLLPKLERMGLISSEESCVGTSTDDKSSDGWTDLFVSRRSFWQLPASLYLFSLTPVVAPAFPGSPSGSRSSSPSRVTNYLASPKGAEHGERATRANGTWTPASPGPFVSGSHLPTYYPPPPPQYTITNNVRHPIRPKPFRQGETFYSCYVPSLNQYLSFRVASLHHNPVAYSGPHTTGSVAPIVPLVDVSAKLANLSTDERGEGINVNHTDTSMLSDVQLLHKWMNNPRVRKFWGVHGGIDVQEDFLRRNLESRHSFPAIGCWDGKPFGYFEIYWAHEDALAKTLRPGEIGMWDRGFHVLVGEEDFRGPHRVKVWALAMAHWMLQNDYRTECVLLDPRIDNTRFISLLGEAGFTAEKEVTYPFRQAVLMRLRRENFDGPAL